MMKVETGFFGNGIHPYIKFGHGEEKMVIFPPSRELLRSLALYPEKEMQSYRKMLPKGLDATVEKPRQVIKVIASFLLD